jgi:hypothetical protein
MYRSDISADLISRIVLRRETTLRNSISVSQKMNSYMRLQISPARRRSDELSCFTVVLCWLSETIIVQLIG